MKFQKCKGFRDLSPAEMVAFRLIEDTFRVCCLKWGYQEVRTPTVEYLHLFTSIGTLTPGMLGKVYSFLDWDGWSGERVVLRPDGTIPIARFFIDSMENSELAKLFYVTNIFIFDEAGTKTRERWQCGAELIGWGSPLTIIEAVLIPLEVLKKLKLENVELRLSHAGLIRALLEDLGLSPEEQTMLFDQILDGNIEALAGLKTSSPELKEVLPSLVNLKGESSGFLKNLKPVFAQSLPEIKSHLDDFIKIADLLEALDCKYKIDIASGAGFEYYTGVIFHFFAGGEKVGGGGRYDALIPSMNGKDIPASGFALYLDRLMKLVKPEVLTKPVLNKVLVKIKSEKTNALRQAFDIANYLREAGYVAEFEAGEQEIAGLRWILEVQSDAPLFTLWDKAKTKRLEAQTIEDVLTFLEAESADKDSPA
ncbi:ATP phosphoribosyltransferase regulatory subunit [Chloroflexota bacterium]